MNKENNNFILKLMYWFESKYLNKINVYLQWDLQWDLLLIVCLM